MPLILPNDIANEQLADGNKLQQNFASIEDWLNTETVLRDGSVAMNQALLLPGAPTQPNQAATKGYVDGAVATATAVVPWIAITAFENGWSNFGGTYAPAAYRKVGDMMHIRGAIAKSNAMFLPSASTFTILPVGYRSPYAMNFPATMAGSDNYGTAGVISSYPDGALQVVRSEQSPTQPNQITLFEVQYSITP